MPEIKHIGAMTLGIIGTNLSDRNEKIKEILESGTSISDNPDFVKLLDINPPVVKQCDCCKKWTYNIHAVSSIFGAFTLSVCDDCILSGRDSYSLMVSYIGCAGRFPDDINEAYQEEVRYQLKLHGKTEEQFIKDVDDYNKDIMEAMISVLESKKYGEGNCDKSEPAVGSDDFS